MSLQQHVYSSGIVNSGSAVYLTRAEFAPAYNQILYSPFSMTAAGGLTATGPYVLCIAVQHVLPGNTNVTPPDYAAISDTVGATWNKAAKTAQNPGGAQLAVSIQWALWTAAQYNSYPTITSTQSGCAGSVIGGWAYFFDKVHSTTHLDHGGGVFATGLAPNDPYTLTVSNSDTNDISIVSYLQFDELASQAPSGWTHVTPESFVAYQLASAVAPSATMLCNAGSGFPTVAVAAMASFTKY